MGAKTANAPDFLLSAMLVKSQHTTMGVLYFTVKVFRATPDLKSPNRMLLDCSGSRISGANYNTRATHIEDF